MNKQNFIIKGLAAFVALVAVAGVATTTLAFNNAPANNSDSFSRPGRAMMNPADCPMAENHEAVENALENGDYQAWKEAIPDDCPMAENITKENFSQLQKAHELREESRNIMEELGVEHGPGMRGGHHRGMMY